MADAEMCIRDRLTVINEWQGWYLVRFDGVVGYASSDFITLI